MTAENLLKKAQSVVHARPAGIQCLRNALRSIDPAGNGKLDREDVRWCLHDFGLELDDEQSHILLGKYDTGDSGLVVIEALLSGLREPLSDSRRNTVRDAFGRWSNGGDKVAVEKLQHIFDAEAAGRALIGGDSAPPTEILDALRAGLGVGSASRTGVATLADFERFHQDLCVHSEDEPLFDEVVKAAWQGGGAAVAGEEKD